MQMAIDSYFGSTHILFPIVDEATVRGLATMPSELDPVNRALLWALCSLGLDASYHGTRITDQGENLLQMAYLAIPSMLACPFRSSVQALLLLAICMRTRNKDGICGTLSGFAIRIAQTLGMHLHQTGESASLDGRICECTAVATTYGNCR
jgi:hypothetical protein